MQNSASYDMQLGTVHVYLTVPLAAVSKLYNKVKCEHIFDLMRLRKFTLKAGVHKVLLILPIAMYR